MNGKKTAISIAWTFVKIAILIAILVIVYRLCFIAYDIGYRIFAEDAIDRQPGVPMTVTIVEGKSVKEIGEILEAKGLIRDSRVFVLQEKFSEYKDELKPGVYELTTAMTPFEMMQVMSAEQIESFDHSNDDLPEPQEPIEETQAEDNPEETPEE